MKTIPTLLLISLFGACTKSDSTDQEAKAHLQYENRSTYQEDSSAMAQLSYKREAFDSLNFSIIRVKHGNELRLESITNNDTKVDSWKAYYKNGVLKEEGEMTTSSHFPIGKLKYYSVNGELDSVVDYDEKQPVSYFRALEIARDHGFEMPDMEVSRHYEGGVMYWEINRWTEMENGRGQVAETRRINSETGEAHEPEDQMRVLY